MKTFHKRFFLVLIVIAPMYWLIFTDDGRRRSDTLILWLAGGDPIDLNFRVLDNRYSMEDWKKVFADIEWNCVDQKTALGDQYCFSEISSYNGVPARYLTAFFRDSHVNAVKLVYRNQYHQQLGADLHQQLGTPLLQSHESADNDMLQWHTDYGMVMVKTELTPEEEASLIWLSK